MDILRCPTCLGLLFDADVKRCPSCRSKIRRRSRPTVMVESNGLSDRPLPLVERELQARIEAETAARFRQRRRAAKVARRIAALPSTVLDGDIVLVQAASEPWDPQPAPAAPTIIDLPAEAMHDVMSSAEFALPEPVFEEAAAPKRRTRRRPPKPRVFEDTFTDVEIVVNAKPPTHRLVGLRTQPIVEPDVEPDVEPAVEPVIDLVAPPAAPKRSPWRRVRSAKVADPAPAPVVEPVAEAAPAARVVFEPVAVEPILEEPVVVGPVVVEQVVVEPVVVESIVGPVVVEQVVVEPVVVEPVVVEPVVVEPEVVVEPVVVEPVVTEPEVVEPEVVVPEVVVPEVVVPEHVEPEIVEPVAVEPEIVEAVPAARWQPSNSLWTDRVFNTATRFRESQTVAWPPQWKPAAEVVDLADDSEPDQVDASRP